MLYDDLAFVAQDEGHCRGGDAEFCLSRPRQGTDGKDFIRGQRLHVLDADAGDADALSYAVEDFQHRSLRLAGEAGDQFHQHGDIAGFEAVLGYVAAKGDFFIQFRRHGHRAWAGIRLVGRRTDALLISSQPAFRCMTMRSPSATIWDRFR